MVVVTYGWERLAKKLTYSSTPIECAWALNAGLVLRKPLREQPSLVRRLFVTPEINAILDGGPTQVHFADAAADAFLTEFMRGFHLRVSRIKKQWPKGNQPHLERLDGHDDVWALCLRTPRPGWRLIGRFLVQDVFVALRLESKFDLVQGKYDAVAAEVITAWSQRFDEVAPLRSLEIGAYITGPWEDMDAREE